MVGAGAASTTPGASARDGRIKDATLALRAAQPPVPRSDGVSCGADAAWDASRRRWERTIIRARMRRPRRSVSRCSAEYAAADPLEDVVTLFEGLFLSALLIPLSMQVSAGLQTDLSAFAAGIPASMDQSADLEGRALSLRGDYTHVAVSEVGGSSSEGAICALAGPDDRRGALPAQRGGAWRTV